MKAIVYDQPGLPLSDPRSLYLTELPKPTPGPRDLLVRVQAISVNPVDTKIRARAATEGPRILGWDAVGTVDEVGAEVSLFTPRETVYFAGAIDRPGSNAEWVLVD